MIEPPDPGPKPPVPGPEPTPAQTPEWDKWVKAASAFNLWTLRSQTHYLWATRIRLMGMDPDEMTDDQSALLVLVCLELQRHGNLVNLSRRLTDAQPQGEAG